MGRAEAHVIKDLDTLKAWGFFRARNIVWSVL